MLVRVSQSEGAAEAVAGAFYQGTAVPAAQCCNQPVVITPLSPTAAGGG